MDTEIEVKKGEKTKRKSNIELLRIICIIMIIAHHYTIHGGLCQYYTLGINKKVAFVKEATRFAQINSAIVFGGAVYTFLFFKNNINFSSKVINFLSSSTLGVYLIHDNPYIRGWVWNKISPGKAYMSSNMILVHAVAKILIIFIICTIIDKIRIFVFEKPIDKLMDKNKR